MKKLFALFIGLSLVLPFQSHAFLGLATKGDLREVERKIELIRYQIEEIQKVLNAMERGVVLGADTVLPFAGSSYTLAGAGISASATSVILTSFTLPQTGYEILDADISNTFYLTLEPGNRTRQEIVSCTTVTQSGSDTTATLSGCTRGLLPISPYTASTTYQFAHGGGTSVVFSNPPQLYNQFVAKDNDETVTGLLQFPTSSASAPRYAGSISSFSGYPTTTLANLDYVNSVATSGAADASSTIKGLIELSTNAEFIAGTATGSTGAYLVPENSFFRSTTTASNVGVVTKSDGKISQGFLNLNEAWTFGATTTIASSAVMTGAFTASGTATFNQTSTFVGNLVFPNEFPSGLIAASTTDVTAAANTTTTIFSVTIPTSTLATAGSIIEATIEVSTTTINAANQTSTWTVSFGGTAVKSGIVWDDTSGQSGGNNAVLGFIRVRIISAGSAAQETTLWFEPYKWANANSTTSAMMSVGSASTISATSSQTLSVSTRLRQSSGQEYIFGNWYVRKIQ